MSREKETVPSMDQWLREAKEDPQAASCGMYLFHDGVVRQSAKASVREGKEGLPPVAGLTFSYEEQKIKEAIRKTYEMPGIYYVKVWLNQGELEVGDDMMRVLVGGDIRPRVIDALQALVEEIKTNCVEEVETFRKEGGFLKAAESVNIIGGADGPTSIFLAGRSGKRPMKVRIRNWIYQLRRRAIARRIRPNAHTLREVTAFMKKHYGAVELSTESREYQEQRKCLKGSLIIEHRPELLGSLRTIPRSRVYDEAFIRKLEERLERQRERIAQIPEDQFPMDFHIYRIRLGGGRMEIEIDYQWDVFGISYSGDKKEMMKLKRMSRRLYIYYGVSKEDIANRSKRYSSLLTVLASD